jgi:trehalose 6-phosphate synthase
VHPYDITGTAETLAAALALPAAERRARAQRLRDAVLAQGPEEWLVGQLAAAAAGG